VGLFKIAFKFAAERFWISEVYSTAWSGVKPDRKNIKMNGLLTPWKALNVPSKDRHIQCGSLWQCSLPVKLIIRAKLLVIFGY